MMLRALYLAVLVLAGCGSIPPQFDLPAFVAQHQAEFTSFATVAADPEKHVGDEVTWIGMPESQSRTASTMIEEAIFGVPSEKPAHFMVRGPMLNLPMASSPSFYRVKGKVAGTAEWGATRMPVLEQATIEPLE